jgi:hypothetical protein
MRFARRGLVRGPDWPPTNDIIALPRDPGNHRELPLPVFPIAIGFSAGGWPACSGNRELNAIEHRSNSNRVAIDSANGHPGRFFLILFFSSSSIKGGSAIQGLRQ